MMLTIIPQQHIATPQPASTTTPCPSLPAIKTVSGTLTAELQALRLIDLAESLMPANQVNNKHNGLATYEGILKSLQSSLREFDTTQNKYQSTTSPSKCLAQWEQSRPLLPLEIIGVDFPIAPTSRQVVDTQTLALVHTRTVSSFESVNSNTVFIGPLPPFANEASSSTQNARALPRLPALGALRLASDLTYHALIPVRAPCMVLITSTDANDSKLLVFPGVNAPKYTPAPLAGSKRRIDQVDKPAVKVDRKRHILEHTKSKVRRNVYHRPDAAVRKVIFPPEFVHEPYNLVWTDWLVSIQAHQMVEFDSPIPQCFYDRMVRYVQAMSKAQLGMVFPIPAEGWLSSGEMDPAEEDFGQQVPDAYPHAPQVHGNQFGRAYPPAPDADDYEPFAYSAANAYGGPPAAVVAGLNDADAYGGPPTAVVAGLNDVRYGGPPAAVVAGLDIDMQDTDMPDVEMQDVGPANHPFSHLPFGPQPTTGHNDFDPAASPDEYGTSPEATPSPPDTFDTATTSPIEPFEAHAQAATIKNLVDRLLQKEQELNQIKAENEAFSVQVHGMIANLRENNNGLEDQCQALFAENKALASRYLALEKDNQSLSEANNALRQNIMRLELKTSSQEYNAAAMTELRRQKDAEILSLGRQIRKLETKNQNLEKELDGAKEEKCDAWAEASKMEDERDEKAARVEELAKELHETKAKLCDAWTETSNTEEGRDFERALKEKALRHIEETTRKLSEGNGNVGNSHDPSPVLTTRLGM